MSNLGTIQITPRDRVLLIVLPALALFILYSFVLTKKPNATLKALTQRVATAEKNKPSEEALAQQRAGRENVAARVAKARAELEPIRAALNKQMDTWQDRRKRLQANDDLTVLWQRHGLSLVEQGTVSTSEAGVTPLIDRLQRQTRTLLNREFGPVLWEVRLRGSFMDAKSALEEISTTDLPVIPVSMEMQSTPQNLGKLWTLRLWQ